MLKKALASAIIAIAVLVAAPAGAQYEPTIEVTISTTELVPGEVFTIAGNVDSFFDEETRDERAFTDAGTVKVLFEDQELGDLQVQSDRGFAGEFTTPDVAPGSYTVHVQYLDSERDIPVQVLGQSSTPFTNGTTAGSGVDRLGRLGLVGLGLHRLHRRQRPGSDRQRDPPAVPGRPGPRARRRSPVPQRHQAPPHLHRLTRPWRARAPHPGRL